MQEYDARAIIITVLWRPLSSSPTPSTSIDWLLQPGPADLSALSLLQELTSDFSLCITAGLSKAIALRAVACPVRDWSWTGPFARTIITSAAERRSGIGTGI